LQRVRQQILLGLAQKQDDPQTIGMQAWLRLALPGDPYARDNEGTTETIAATTADDLRAAHQRIFRREFLQVAVVGDIDAATLGAMLDKVFGTLPSGARDAALPPVAPATGPKRQIVDREMPQSIILFGHEGLPIADPDFIAAYVMSEILGGGDFGTRLTEEIREKRGLTYGISFTLWPQDRTDLYFGMLQTSNAKAAEALALVKDVLARMAAEGPTQQELDEVKSYLTGSYALRFSSNAAIAGQLLGMQQAGRPIDYVLKRNSLIEAVTLDQVKAQARRLLHPDRLLVTIVGKPANLD
jgi:zinc protease